MPNYSEPFGQLAGAAGGAAGAGAGGLLGELLGGLNMPRKALWALPGRLAHGDYLGALPGLAGLAAGGLTAATGFGAPFAGLVGSAVGGLGEGIEESLRPDMEKAPEASDLVKQLGGDPDSFGGQALGMGLSMAGDPLSYAGGLGGEAAGKAAGEAGGEFLEHAATARGPRYPGGEEKLTDLLGQLQGVPGSLQFRDNVPQLLKAPELSRLLGEIEPGSTPVAAGMEGLVLKRPSGGVTRVAGLPGQLRVEDPTANTDWNSPPPARRADDPMMMQNVRDVPLGSLRAEHMPEAKFGKFAPGGVPVDDLARLVHHAGGKDGPLAADVMSRGRDAVDMHGGNIGMTNGGKIAIVDPSNVLLPDGEKRPEAMGAPPQGWLTNKLLDLLGADQGVRNDINTGVKQISNAGLPPDEIEAFHKAKVERILQAKAQRDAAMAQRPGGTLPGDLAGLANPPGAPVWNQPPSAAARQRALLGPNVGLPTNVGGPSQSEQASELMKALGLEPSEQPPSPFSSGSFDLGSPQTANFDELPVEHQQDLLRELLGQHQGILGQANEQAAAGQPVADLMDRRNSVLEKLIDAVGYQRAEGMLEHGTPSGFWPPAEPTGMPEGLGTGGPHGTLQHSDLMDLPPELRRLLGG
jgi:hypothetical protein